MAIANVPPKPKVGRAPFLPGGTIATRENSSVSTENRPASQRHTAFVSQRLVEASSDIRQGPPERAEFLHTVLCHVGFPRRRTDARVFERTSGNVSVRLEAGTLYTGDGWHAQPLPYGTVPRLIMVHLSSEAIRTRRRTVELGDSVRQFLARLGMSASGGPRGGYAALSRQLAALAACRLTLGMQEAGRIVTVDAKPIKRFEAWLHRDGLQRTLWPAALELSEDFYGTLIEHAVPLDHRALAALKHSALALDVYTWLAHRLCRVRGHNVRLSWQNLREQFGQEYQDTRNFKHAFRAALRQALAVYPDARVSTVPGGLVLRPSRPPLNPKLS